MCTSGFIVVGELVVTVFSSFGPFFKGMPDDERYQSLLSTARLKFEQGDPQTSLKLCEEALKIKECPKLLRKIKKIKEFIASEEKENTANECAQSAQEPVEAS